MVTIRVYRALRPPISGGKSYYDVKTVKDAIKLTRMLNYLSKRPDWVWGQSQ